MSFTVVASKRFSTCPEKEMLGAMDGVLEGAKEAGGARYTLADEA